MPGVFFCEPKCHSGPNTLARRHSNGPELLAEIFSGLTFWPKQKQCTSKLKTSCVRTSSPVEFTLRFVRSVAVRSLFNISSDKHRNRKGKIDFGNFEKIAIVQFFSLLKFGS